jgi:hypothetical protein
MTAEDPEDRPSAGAVLEQWRACKAAIPFRQQTQTLRKRNDYTNSTGFFLLPFLSAGPVLLVKGWFSRARWANVLC